jgi:hypothetical protein
VKVSVSLSLVDLALVDEYARSSADLDHALRLHLSL